MTGKLPSFFKETIEVMLNLCLTVYYRAFRSFLIFIYGRGLAISSAKEGKTGLTYNLGTIQQ